MNDMYIVETYGLGAIFLPLIVGDIFIHLYTASPGKSFTE